MVLNLLTGIGFEVKAPRSDPAIQQIVGMRFLIAADIVYQLMSTTLAGRAGCARIEQRAQSEELRKVPRE